MSQMLTASTPFSSGRGRALAVIILLAACAVFDSIGSLLTALQLAAGKVSDPNSEEVSLFDAAGLGVGLLQLLVYLATVVAFCMWLYRAARNLTALGNPKQALKHSPWWAVGSFFVPFINLVVPYRAVKELWAKSDPEVTADNFIPSYEPSPPSIFPLWWAFWLLTNFANNIAMRLYLRAETTAAMTVAMWFDLIGDALSIPAALFAIAVVRSIERRQQERSRRVSYIEHVPPPPLYSPPPAPSFGGSYQ